MRRGFQVVPFGRPDRVGVPEVIAYGYTLGAFPAATSALKRTRLFPLAVYIPGNYDPAARDGRGERAAAA
jgi:hypothetical protein